ncbi:MAG: DUF5819 family protein [Aeromicrobium erythreum]
MSTAPTPQHTRHTTDVPGAGRRSVVWLLTAVVVVHSLLVMLWVMPDNPTRQAVGPQRLASYINPYFEQSWSVFAPVPRRGGENVVVRAFVGDPDKPDEGKVSPWFDITRDEDQRIAYLVNPSRIHSATRRLGGNINTTMAKFSPQQKLLVRGNYVQDSPSELVKRLEATNRLGVVGDANIEQFAENQQMLTTFLTMYTRARWGKDVTMVQYRVGHRTVPNFDLRKQQKFTDVPFTYYVFGWRRTIAVPQDAQQAFDGYVRKAPRSQLRPADDAELPQGDQ